MTSDIKNIFKTCSFCKESFSSLRELIRHEQTHGQRQETIKFGIPQISTISIKTSNIGSSIKSELPENSQYWQCRDCPVKFPERRFYMNHIRDYHMNDPNSNAFIEWESTCRKMLIGATKFTCQYCGVSYPFLSSLEKHRKSAHGGRTFRQFGKISKSYDDVPMISDIVLKDDEKQAKTNRSSGRYGCEFCYGTVSRAYFLSCHSSVLHFLDGVDSPAYYFCHVCTRNKLEKDYFENGDDFRNHMAKRHGILTKLAKNTDDETKTSTAVESNFQNRISMESMKRYSHKNLLTCRYCLGKFSSDKYIRRHELQFHLIAPRRPRYFCSICRGTRKYMNVHTYDFGSEVEFRIHVAKVHGIKTKERNIKRSGKLIMREDDGSETLEDGQTEMDASSSAWTARTDCVKTEPEPNTYQHETDSACAAMIKMETCETAWTAADNTEPKPDAQEEPDREETDSAWTATIKIESIEDRLEDINQGNSSLLASEFLNVKTESEWG